IFYVTDNGQRDHFDMVFAGAVALGYAKPEQLTHVPFGLVQNEQKKRFKTRSGDVIRLQDLLDEGYQRAYAIGQERGVPDCENFAKVVGYGAIKYADLSLYRLMDYVFNWDSMLAFQGNTVVYLLYTVVRCRSIIRKAAVQNIEPVVAIETLAYDYHVSEKELILHLAQYDHMIAKVLDQSAPHYACDYLYDLSAKFNHFFRDCPILKSEVHAAVRLSMVQCVDRTMTHVLKLLGIETVDEM
ncbi:MAG: arginine--tRNA ligase, partial [Gammaproteobacteria bacterium]|nr:arginine--tRNA ligase [Gammaproteobacteria bacterium]